MLPAVKTVGVQLSGLVTESAHGVTGVASLILLADIGDQRLGALHFDFERGDQCIFGVNDDVSGFALNFKADRKLHLCLPLSMLKNSTILLRSGAIRPRSFFHMRGHDQAYDGRSDCE
jgi:hypothetical protein